MSSPGEFEEELEHHELVEQLELACDEEDIPRIARLLTTTSLDSDDVTDVVNEEHSIRTLQCLLEHGADADRLASSLGGPSLDVLKLLTRFGYDVKANGHLILQDYADSRETLDWLLDQGADINDSNHDRTDAFGIQPPQVVGHRDYSVKVLNNVAQLGDVQLFAHLVNRGADPQRSTALHAVSMCREPAKAKAMIDHLLDTHHMDLEAYNGAFHRTMFRHDEGTPLHCAVHCRNLDTLSHLLLRGADPESAMGYAIGDCLYRSFHPAVGLLIDAGANADCALSRAADCKDVEAARICVAHGANLSVVIEEQRAKAAAEQARRESVAKDTGGDGEQDHDSRSIEGDDDEQDHGSQSSEEEEEEEDDDDDEPDAWTQMEEFFCSVKGTRGCTSKE